MSTIFSAKVISLSTLKAKHERITGGSRVPLIKRSRRIGCYESRTKPFSFPRNFRISFLLRQNNKEGRRKKGGTRWLGPHLHKSFYRISFVGAKETALSGPQWPRGLSRIDHGPRVVPFVGLTPSAGAPCIYNCPAALSSKDEVGKKEADESNQRVYPVAKITPSSPRLPRPRPCPRVALWRRTGVCPDRT